MSVTIIAEIGSNWDPSRPCASFRELAQAAKDAGADWIKVQDWSPISEMRRSDEWKERCAPWTVGARHIHYWKKFARQLGLGFLASVFTRTAVDMAIMHRYAAVKVASSEIGNHYLLSYVNENALQGVPVLLSLGERGKGNDRIRLATSWLNRHRVTLMHCVAEYPVHGECFGGEIAALAARFGLPVGWSSHVSYPEAVPCAAWMVMQSASVVEAHIRLETTRADCPDNGDWALYPGQFAEMVEAVREATPYG